MAQKVRIARVDASAFQPVSQSNRPVWDHYPAIVSFIRRYLPATSASVFAEPFHAPGTSFMDWYSDIGGQPVPYASLDQAEKAKVGKLLADRLQALRELASRQAGDPAAAALAVALTEPPEDAIYAINGQPVIIGWGRQGAAPVVAPRPAVPPAAAAAVAAPATVAATVVPRERFPWLPVAVAVALLLLAALLWWLWPLVGLGRLGVGGDRMAALQAEEAALGADIAAAEAELRRRLGACPTAEVKPALPDAAAAPPPPAAAPVVEAPPVKEPPPPVKETPPAKEPAAKAPPPVKEQPKHVTAEPPVKKAPPPQQQAMAEPPATEKQACPPPRKKWEVPELVVLLDASGSMRLQAGISQEEVMALVRRARMGDRGALAQLRSMEHSGNDRLTAAKAAVNRLVTTLPTDLDVGLVVFGNCHGADNHKFFSPAERPRLASLLESIKPMEGTPLARGIERAGNVVDGRSVPATLVVVTDGEDSCGGDPCAAARALKAAKPKVTINVVDVNGLGEGRCMAEVTGGKVLPMRSAAELPELIRRASGEAPLPPGCG
jgi:hypothetical protein